MSRFYEEVVNGLSRGQKSLPSKYFYDAAGDRLFQGIMGCPEYYLTRCEMEIFQDRAAAVAEAIGADEWPFDLIELGAGDGTKTVHLLKHLAGRGADFRYLPIDISAHILEELQKRLLGQLPDLSIQLLQGEYLEMLARAASTSRRRKVVLFLGSNIGNVLLSDAAAFCRQIRALLQPADAALIGFDLMKNPRIIRAAYDDAQGITRAFNLNLLTRINTELGADFNTALFDHYCNYDPETGACKSYLVSLAKHEVRFPGRSFSFEEGEAIWVEISQKYSLRKIDELAAASGFEPAAHLTDSKGWFADVAWKAV